MRNTCKVIQLCKGDQLAVFARLSKKRKFIVHVTDTRKTVKQGPAYPNSFKYGQVAIGDFYRVSLQKRTILKDQFHLTIIQDLSNLVLEASTSTKIWRQIFEIDLEFRRKKFKLKRPIKSIGCIQACLDIVVKTPLLLNSNTFLKNI